MKINIIIPFTSLTGGIRVIFLYANYLYKKGYDVVCYVPKISYRFDMNNWRLFKNIVKNTFFYKKFANWFDNDFKIISVPIISNYFIRDADIVIATAWPTANDVYKFDKSKGEKIYFIQAYEIFSGAKLDVDKTYKLGLHNITVTKQLQSFLNKEFNTDSTVIYNGLSESEFITKPKVRNRIPKILMLANGSPGKGLKEGLDILDKLSKKYKIKVTLFGTDYLDSIPKSYSFYHLPKRSELMKLYEEADIYLFTSKYESWGLPVLEAWGNKCGVVGMNTGVLKEIGVNNKNSIICDNYNELYNGLEKVLDNDLLLAEIQNNGFNTAKKFNWNTSYELFENYLRSLIDEKSVNNNN